MYAQKLMGRQISLSQ